MKQVVLIYIISLIPFLAFSQVEGEVYVANNHDGKGCLVRWISPEIYFEGGLDIYRSENDNGWSKLNGAKIFPPKSLGNGIKLNAISAGFFSAYLDESHEEFKTGFSGIFAIIESVKHFNLALALGVAYIDETAVKGKNYKYKVIANFKGKEKVIGISESLKVEDYKPLPSFKAVTSVRKKKKIGLKWENDEKHLYFINVYRKTNKGSYTIINKEPLTTSTLDEKFKFYYEDLNVNIDSIYTYKIQGLDYFGQPAEFSKEIKVLVKDFVPPLIPLMTLLPLSKELTTRVSWIPTTDTDIEGYNVLRSNNSDSNYVQINKKLIAASDTVYMDVVNEIGSFYYKLEVVDLSENKTQTFMHVTQIRDIVGPNAPKNFKVVPDVGLMKMSWEPCIESDLKGYRIMRALASEGEDIANYKIVNTTLIDTNYYEQKLDKNVTAPFVYLVLGVDSSINMGKPSNNSEGKLPDVTPPVMPFAKQVVVNDSVLKINWLLNNEKDLVGYNLYKRKKGDTLPFEQLNYILIPKDISQFTDKNVKRGIAYEYCLEALDKSKLNSEKSNLISGTLPLLPLEGTIEISKQKYNQNKKEIQLVWSPNLKNEVLVGYIVYCAVNGGKSLPISKLNLENDYRKKIKQAGKHVYQIRAYGKRGNIVKSTSVEIEVIL